VKCTLCGTALEEAVLDRVTVHDCPEGHGTWFEREELRRAKDNADRDVRWLDFDVFSQASSSSAGSKPCPRCAEPMKRETYPHSDVTIDVCENDHGVWLDKGEFDTIVRALEEVTHEMTVTDYGHAAKEQLEQVLTGPESRLSELRDFLAVFRLLEMRMAVEHPGVAASVQQLERSGL
jgi:Zn-finger nucleic acid-binding protein